MVKVRDLCMPRLPHLFLHWLKIRFIYIFYFLFFSHIGRLLFHFRSSNLVVLKRERDLVFHFFLYLFRLFQFEIYNGRSGIGEFLLVLFLSGSFFDRTFFSCRRSLLSFFFRLKLGCKALRIICMVSLLKYTKNNSAVMNNNNPKPGIPTCEISQLLTLYPCSPPG